MLTGNDALRIRTKLVAFIFIIFFFGLWIWLYFVQVIRHDELYGKARKQYTATKTTTSKRGEIFDTNGNLLVGNAPCDDIIADPSIVAKNPKKCRQVSKIFAAYLNLDYKTLHAKLSRGTRTYTDENGKKVTRPNRYAVIARQVPLETSRKLKKIIFPEKKKKGKKKGDEGFKGIFFKETHKRYYPKNELLANILGFTNVNHGKVIPVLGVERYLNKQIASSESKVRFERSLDGRPLDYGVNEQSKVQDGWDVYLTVSEPLQAIVEEELEKLCAKWKPRAAYAIMADPYTGNVLAVGAAAYLQPQ